jgi:hypothetical protein
MLVSGDQNAGQNRDIKISNRSFENVSQFKYLGYQNLIQEEIKEEIELWQCLLPLRQETSVFLSAIEK